MSSSCQFSLALVTGASSGIGEDLCRLLARKGVNLIITGRNRDRLDLLTKELRAYVNVIPFAADLAVPSERGRVIEHIHEHAPDLVINNAGFGLYGDVLTYSTAEQMAILNVNANAMLEITLEAGRTLITDGKCGVIMNVASAAAYLVFPKLAVYSAAKTFVRQISQALDIEMQPQGIRVLCACPGMVATEFSRRAGGLSTGIDTSLVMSSVEAAEQILWQIEQGKAVHIFDWRTRLATYLSRCFPQSLVAKVISSRIATRIPKRSFLPLD